MKTLGVILARAGSAGLHNKHLLPLCGRRVIEYTFDHARQSQRLSRVVVSTDSAEIQMLARQHGFDVIERPPELATADASVQDVMLHALRTIESAGNVAPNRTQFIADALAVIYGNVPVRPPRVIDQAIELLEQTRCDSVRSFCPVGKWHPAWMSKLDGNMAVALQAGSIHRRQDLEELYLHDGAALVVSRESMLRALRQPSDPHAFFGLDRRAVRTEMGQTVEIDHQRDLYWAEAVLRENETQLRKAI